MNILVFGSTSGLGRSVTNIFAEKNNFILVGRSRIELENIKKNVISKGAINVDIFEHDLAKDLNFLIEKIENVVIHLFINMASATSTLRDNNIGLDNIRSDVNVDLINPILLIRHLIDRNNQLKVIFISSILSRIKSPNRVIYSSFKSLQEVYLNKIAKHHSNKLNLLLVTIGTEIKKNRETEKSRTLAKKIFSAYLNGEKTMFFGLKGRVFYFLYNLNPIFLRSIIYLKRKIVPLEK